MRSWSAVSVVVGLFLMAFATGCMSEDEKSREEARAVAVEIAESWVLPEGFEVVEVHDALAGLPSSGKDAGGWGHYGYYLNAPEGMAHQEIAFVLDEMVLAAGGDNRTFINSDRSSCSEDYSRVSSWSGNYSVQSIADFRPDTFESRGGPAVKVILSYDYSGELYYPERDVVENLSSPLCPGG